MPRRHLRRTGVLLARHYKLGCSGLQSKQLHLKANAAYSIHANPAGALIYQKASLGASAKQRHPQSRPGAGAASKLEVHGFRHYQTADLAVGLTRLSSQRDTRSGQLSRQRLSPNPPAPARQQVTQAHGGLDRLASAMLSRSQQAPTGSSAGAPQSAARRSSDRHRARRQRNAAALSTLQTIFE
ncbi:hypothetical protein WJX84_002589 [Apatococcus fuscideae]|uniref:Uncharacterized protein n=1 Tax=Apatococcus fuscideae TaxID=2026836 RepID=A0AAW1SND5_9CHLO